MCAEEENKKTEATVEQEHATGLYQIWQVMPPQSREASDIVAVSHEELSHVQMSTS